MQSIIHIIETTTAGNKWTAGVDSIAKGLYNDIYIDIIYSNDISNKNKNELLFSNQLLTKQQTEGEIRGQKQWEEKRCLNWV